MKKRIVVGMLFVIVFCVSFGQTTPATSAETITKIIVVQDDTPTYRWLFPTDTTGWQITPAIDRSGNLVFVKNEKELVCLDASRSIQWVYTDCWRNGSNPVIGEYSGEIYIVNAYNQLIVLNSRGKPLAQIALDQFPLTLAMKTNGQILCYDGSLKTFAYDAIAQKIQLLSSIQLSMKSAMILGPKNTVIFVDGNNQVVCLKESGIMEWAFTPEGTVSTELIMGADHSVYFGSSTGILYALDFYGRLKMAIHGLGNLTGSPVIGNDGSLFVIHEKGIRKVRTDGTLLWEISDETVFNTLLLSRTGTLYATSASGKVYAIEAQTGQPLASFDTKLPIGTGWLLQNGALYGMTSVGLLALGIGNQQLSNSAWPMYRQDVYRSGRGFIPIVSKYPFAAQNPFPQQKSTVQGDLVTLKWQTDETAVVFDLYFGSTPMFEVVVENLDTTYYPLSGLNPQTRYFWKIVTRNEAGQIESEVWEFTTK